MGLGVDSLRIAMIDDSSLIVGKIREVITEVPGAEFVGTAVAIEPALELLEEVQPDALILDINLRDESGKNGIDLLAMIRNVYPLMKILMLTNRAGDRYRTLCFAKGADYFFDKSNDIEKIPETLRRISELKRSR